MLSGKAYTELDGDTIHEWNQQKQVYYRPLWVRSEEVGVRDGEGVIHIRSLRTEMKGSSTGSLCLAYAFVYVFAELLSASGSHIIMRIWSGSICSTSCMLVIQSFFRESRRDKPRSVILRRGSESITKGKQ